MAAYGTIITNLGEALIANGFLLSRKVDITHMAIGDGGGGYYQPTPGMTALRNEVARVTVNEVALGADSGNVVIITALVPGDLGGFTIREAGAYDADGNLVAIMNTPDTQKVVAVEGASSELHIKMQLAVSYTDSIQFTSDPATIIATKQNITEHNESGAAHPEIWAQLEGLKLEDTALRAGVQEAKAALTAHDQSDGAHQGRIRSQQDQLSVLSGRVKTLENMLTTDIAENQTYIFFDSLGAAELVQGNYNTAVQRVECTKGV